MRRRLRSESISLRCLHAAHAKLLPAGLHEMLVTEARSMNPTGSPSHTYFVVPFTATEMVHCPPLSVSVEKHSGSPLLATAQEGPR